MRIAINRVTAVFGVEPEEASVTTAPELVFDEELNTYRLKAQPVSTQRKPETGERLDGTPKPTTPGRCYICFARPWTVKYWDNVPKCTECNDRFRRKD